MITTQYTLRSHSVHTQITLSTHSVYSDQRCVIGRSSWEPNGMVWTRERTEIRRPVSTQAGVPTFTAGTAKNQQVLNYDAADLCRREKLKEVRNGLMFCIH